MTDHSQLAVFGIHLTRILFQGKGAVASERLFSNHLHSVGEANELLALSIFSPIQINALLSIRRLLKLGQVMQRWSYRPFGNFGNRLVILLPPSVK